MNTGQVMLTTLALVLLGTTVFSVNRNSLNNNTILRQTELGIYAVSLATSYIQRASELDWDENTVGGLVFINIPMPQPPSIPTGVHTSTSTFDATPPGSLGPDAGETNNFDNTYDDFDDYNGYTKDTLVAGVDTFHVSASVYYVGQTPPYTKVTANATWQKEMNVSVNSKVNRNVFSGEVAGTDTIKLVYIYAFYR